MALRLAHNIVLTRDILEGTISTTVEGIKQTEESPTTICSLIAVAIVIPRFRKHVESQRRLGMLAMGCWKWDRHK